MHIWTYIFLELSNQELAHLQLVFIKKRHIQNVDKQQHTLGAGLKLWSVDSLTESSNIPQNAIYQGKKRELLDRK